MAQSLARLWTHLIFSTKNRFPFLTDKVLRAEMHAYLAEMLRNQTCETLIVGGVEDHTHSLFALSTVRLGLKAEETLTGLENLIG